MNLFWWTLPVVVLARGNISQVLIFRFALLLWSLTYASPVSRAMKCTFTLAFLQYGTVSLGTTGKSETLAQRRLAPELNTPRGPMQIVDGHRFETVSRSFDIQRSGLLWVAGVSFCSTYWHGSQRRPKSHGRSLCHERALEAVV